MNYSKIAVVIPCYRVEKSVASVINKIPSFVDWIICVNDCSPDATAEAIQQVTDPRVTLLSHQKNQGVGGAMLTGYSCALQRGAQVVVKIDGDDQMDPRYMTRLIDPILSGEADYVKGNRFMHPIELKRMPLIRKIGNLGLTFLTKVASGYWNIFDPTNGYTAISANALFNLDPQRIARNYFFETSMLCELRRNNMFAKDVAIPAIYQDEQSSLKVSNQLFIFSFNLFKRFLSRIFYQYFMFDFNSASFFIVMGIIFGLFGGIWGIVKWAESSRTGIAATTGTVLLAVLPIILGVQFLVQATALDIGNVPSRTSRENITDAMSRSLMYGYYDDLKDRGQVKLEKQDGK